MDSEFNKRASECSGHRMVIVSSEVLYTNKSKELGECGHSYTYRCNGSCQQTHTQVTKD